MKECFCRSNNCGGKLVSIKTRNRHSDQDYQTLKKESQQNKPDYIVYDRRINFDEDLYKTSEVATTKLFPGSRITVLEALFAKFRTFCAHPFSTKTELDELFRADNMFNLPESNHMPSSYREARKLIEPFLFPLERYDVCVNDCIVFRKDALNFKSCNICKEARYKNNGKPRRTFTYFPLGPRLGRILGTRSLEDLFFSKQQDGEYIGDIQDTDTWSLEWFDENGLLQGRTGKIFFF